MILPAPSLGLGQLFTILCASASDSPVCTILRLADFRKILTTL